MAEKRYGSSGDIPGRKREYETIFIVRPDLANDAIAAVNTKVRTVVEGNGGKLLKIENWGRRKLAYEVRKQLKGIYLFWRYLGGAGLVEEGERNLRLAGQALRYYSVKVANNVDAATSATEVTDESFASAAVPGPDEEAIATGQAGARPFGDEDEDAGFDFEEAFFGGTEPPPRRSE